MILINPIASVYEFFLNFWSFLPLPAVSFASLALVFFAICSVVRWFND